MNDKVQIDARENRNSWKRLAQYLVICRLAWAVQNRLLSFFWWTLNEILLNSKSIFFFPSLCCENHTISYLFHFFFFFFFFLFIKSLNYIRCFATESLTACFSDRYGTPYLCYFQCFYRRDRASLNYSISILLVWRKILTSFMYRLIWAGSSEFGSYHLCEQRRCSLARISANRSNKQWVKRNLQTESQIPGPSEWLGMSS